MAYKADIPKDSFLTR